MFFHVYIFHFFQHPSSESSRLFVSVQDSQEYSENDSTVARNILTFHTDILDFYNFPRACDGQQKLNWLPFKWYNCTVCLVLWAQSFLYGYMVFAPDCLTVDPSEKNRQAVKGPRLVRLSTINMTYIYLSFGSLLFQVNICVYT